MSDKTILVVEDDELMREFLQEAIAGEDWTYLEATSAEEGLRLFKEQDPDLVLADVRMPGESGIELLKDIRELDQRIPVVIITAYAETDTAIEALRHMASDFLKKPFEAPEIIEVIRKQLRRSGSRDQVIEGYEPIYASSAMETVMDQARSIAGEQGPVLIEGESGVGKEVIARFIHYQSDRGEQPMVSINCGAIPKQLLESELFGHKQGAFTGATEDREGLFVTADGGSLFLDEIAEMPLELQAKLLRALENREIKPLGSDESRSVDVRIIAASNQDVANNVESGQFREDLYYRLNVFHLVIPPLRDRPGDVGPLLNHFMEKFSVDAELDEAMLTKLREYDWPGNVRQLQNFVRRLKTMDPDDVIKTTKLGPVEADSELGHDNMALDYPPEPDLEAVLNSVKAHYIKQAIQESGGNKSEAARQLGMNRTTLVETMKRLGIDQKEED
jgi:DNA-binding NtrC family response regulator